MRHLGLSLYYTCKLVSASSCAETLNEHAVSIGGSMGGLGGTCPPRPFEIWHFLLSYFFVGVRFRTCVAKLAYRFLNIAGDQRMCGKYSKMCATTSPATGRFVELGESRKMSATTPPPLNRPGFLIKITFLLLPPPH